MVSIAAAVELTRLWSRVIALCTPRGLEQPEKQLQALVERAKAICGSMAVSLVARHV